jgi:predicted neuraminidase
MIKEYIPQPEGFKHAHCATIAEHNQELYCVWYVYNQEEYSNARLALSQFNSSTKRWSRPKLILSDRGQSQGNPCLFSFKNNLYFLFVLLEGHYWNSAALHVGQYDPLQGEIRDVHKIEAPIGTMVRHRPLIKSNQILLPAYEEETKRTVLYELTPPFKELHKMGALEPGPIQADLIPGSGEELLLVLRDTSNQRKVMRTHSSDGGMTFPFPVYASPFECPLSGVAAVKDREGNIIVAHNNTKEHKRTPLSLSLSKDNLKSIYKSLDIQFGPGEYSYPSLLLDFGGSLHLVFTSNREKIGHFMLHEDDLKVISE